MSIQFWQSQESTEQNEDELRAQLLVQGYSVSKYVYPPGCYFPDHSHSFSKIEVVLAGCFRMGMLGEYVDLLPGQGIHVPKGVIHSAEVIGDQPVICLDAIAD